MRMKKIALLMALMLALLPCAALADETAQDLILDRWMSYLKVEEEIIRDQLRVYDAVLAFNETRAWDDLVRARTAVGIAVTSRSAAGRMTLSPELTAIDRLRLESSGMDIQALMVKMKDVNACLGTDLLSLLELGMQLHDSYFGLAMLEDMVEYAGLQKEYCQDSARELCIMTNHMLNGLTDPARAESYWAELDAAVPCIAGFKGAYESDDLAVEQAYIALLEKQEDWAVRQAAYVGGIQHSLYEMEMLIAKDAKLVEDDEIVLVEGAPLKLPMPTWWLGMGDDMFFAYTISEEGDLTRMDSASPADMLPDVSVVSSRGADKAELVAYADLLAELGMKVTYESGDPADEGDWSRTLTVGRVRLSIRWSGSTGYLWNFGNEAMFVPTWYMRALNQRK